MAHEQSSQSRNLSDWIHDLQSPLAALRAIRADETTPAAAELLRVAIDSLERIVARMQDEGPEGAPPSVDLLSGEQASASTGESGPIVIPRGAVVAVLDDDPAIHLAWSARLEKLPAGRIGRLVVVSSPQEMRLAMREFPDLFLVDFDLAGHAETGLDLIIELGIARQAWLVTGRTLDEKLQERCSRHGVRVLSKEHLSDVPLVFEE